MVHIIGHRNKLTSDIEVESIDSFLQESDDNSAGYFRFKLDGNEKLAEHFLDSIQHTAIRFDEDFDLMSDDKLYCTELIARCLAYATGELQYFKPSTINDQPYISIGDLIQKSSRIN